MVRFQLRELSLVALVMGGAVSAVAAQEASAVVTYDQVRAVFKKRCLTCHDADRARDERRHVPFMQWQLLDDDEGGIKCPLK